MRQAELQVLSGKQTGTVIPLVGGKFLIGREEDCHLRPNSDLVSRHHCVFSVDDFTVRLRDLGSTNGTIVNGERIRGGVELTSGDVVSIGKIEFRIVIKDPASDTSSSIIVDHDTRIISPGAQPQEAPSSSPSIPVVPQVGDESEGSAFEIPALSQTISDLPQVSPPGFAAGVFPSPPTGDTQFSGMPMAGQMGYPQMGYPPMGYPQMGYPQMPQYGYQGYPQQMYGQPMGYPMPQGYPQPGYPVMAPAAPVAAPVEEAPAAAPKAAEMAVKLPDPSETGAKAPAPKPVAPPVSGDAKNIDQKNKEEAPKRAEDIINQYLKRRPTSDGKK